MNTHPKSIAFLCSRLDLPGGIERTVVNLANLFAEKKHSVTLIILDKTKQSFYPIHPSINIIQQPLLFGITEKGNVFTRKMNFILDIIRLRRLLKTAKAHIVIPTEYPFAIAGVLCGGKKYSRIISWEHHHFHWLKRNRFWQFLFNKTYPKLELVVCQNKDEIPYYTVMGCRATAIPYHMHLKPSFVQKEDSKEILSVGWLIPRKGIDLLMKVANGILKKYPEWTWKIIGDGPMKEELLHFISENNLKGKLILKKPVSHDITSYYKNASIFVLTSRMESFGMVLAEAMCHGVPAVAFDCETGPRNVITNYIDGFLAGKENSLQLSEAISKLIESPLLRKKMGENAVISIERFAPEVIYQLWKEKIFT
ncbi:MAG TPA: glycosyltransferase family 4 protein [Chitinophagaceae bacterium]